jgi:hypothetical protein
VVLLLVGNTAITAASDFMFPGRYHLGGFGLTTSNELAAARWMGSHHPGVRIVSDPASSLVQWEYGDVTPVSFPTWELTFGDPNRKSVRKLLRAEHVQYLVVDRLMYREVSPTGYIYSSIEPGAFHEPHPLPIQDYYQLSTAPWIRSVYVNHQMAIFRLRP